MHTHTHTFNIKVQKYSWIQCDTCFVCSCFFFLSFSRGAWILASKITMTLSLANILHGKGQQNYRRKKRGMMQNMTIEPFKWHRMAWITPSKQIKNKLVLKCHLIHVFGIFFLLVFILFIVAVPEFGKVHLLIFRRVSHQMPFTRIYWWCGV